MNENAYNIRNYKPEDVEKLKALRTWVAQGSKDSCVHPVDEVLRDLHRPDHCPERDLFLAERDDNAVVAYMDVIPEKAIKRAVLNYLVRPGEGFANVFRELLHHSMERSEELGVDYIHINVPEPDIATRELLAHEGFRVAKRYVEMVTGIEGRDFCSEIPLGTCLRSLRKGEEDKLRDIQNRAFTGSWGFNPNSLEEIIHRINQPDTSPEEVIICLQEHRPVAYCWTVACLGAQGLPEKRARVHMLGVDPEFRGTGAGKAVLVAGLSHLKRKGFCEVVLTCDSENTTALSLYERVGFRVHSSSLWYERKTP